MQHYRTAMRCLAGVCLSLACLMATALSAQPQRQMPQQMPPQMQQRMQEMQQQRQGQPPAQASVPWIDVHLHLIPGRGQLEDYAGAVEAALQEMDRFGIRMALILPPPYGDKQPNAYDYPSYAGALRRFPGRFAYLGGGGSLNPILHRHADPASVTEEMKRDFAAMAEKVIDSGAVGFGEMASLHISWVPGHPFEYVPADHPLFRVLADVAAKRDVPIDLHMDALERDTPTPQRFAGSPNPETLPATMQALDRLLTHNLKARIVWAHGGSDPLGAMTPQAIGRLMDAHANLFVSLRIVGAQAPMQNKALTGGGLDPAWAALLNRHADRFVIGTDSFIPAPSLAGRGSGPGMMFSKRNTPKFQATVHFLSLLPPEVQRKVASENAVRIYKLAGR